MALSLRERLTMPALLAATLGLIGVLWRVVVAAFSAPVTNSDEAIVGLMALHIAKGNDVPIYYYGQHYMGSIEAILAAPVVWLLGPTVLALRIVTLACYALFLLLMYHLTRRVFTPWLAVVTVGLLALGGDYLLRNQLMAIGGYPESLPMVTGLILLTYLMITRRLTHLWALAVWGLLFGLIAWNHWTPAPFVGGAFAVLVAFWMLSLRTAVMTGDVKAVLGVLARGLTVAGTAVLGALPLIIDNLQAAPANRSLTLFRSLSELGPPSTQSERIVGGIFTGLPNAMGMCGSRSCFVWSRLWAPILVGLLVYTAALAAQALVGRWWRHEVDGQEAAREAIRLVLALGALATIAAYLRSPAAGSEIMYTSRYLAMLPMSLPAILWPFWRAAGRWRSLRRLTTVAVAALALTLTVATVNLALALPGYREQRRDMDRLIATLDAEGVTYVHAEYWACNWIPYLTDERILCGVVGTDQSFGQNRYPPYWRDTAQAVVVRRGLAMDEYLSGQAPLGVRVVTVGAYRIFPSPQNWSWPTPAP